ncbi:hypothetical protein [Actinacidiphila sp. bgisy167]|uniref:hypothetical protein n=1 Tax=Actinacidiphila sp. bgisy167 TaxID=3413797 RepID=UPI003D765F9F
MTQDIPVPEQDAPVPGGPPVRPPRRRGRTTLLIACAAVLGVLAGAGAGYKIQYDRPETPLPPLAQPKLVQPKGAAPSAKPLTAAEDTLVTSDGDLRKLLLKRPKGAKDLDGDIGRDHWYSLYDYASTFEEPGGMFAMLNGNDFRRAAVSAWRTGGYATSVTTEVHLIQFRDETHPYTADMLEGQQEYMGGKKYAGNKGTAVPGTFDGRAWVYSKPWTEPGYLPQYAARALARKGTVMMDIWVQSARPIKKSTIMSLAERQWERL